jgi:hypothetical protein
MYDFNGFLYDAGSGCDLFLKVSSGSGPKPERIRTGNSLKET